jgi:AraC-like DNA-binding protein
LLRLYRGAVTVERVQMWRADPADRLLLMAGRTDRYVVRPRGEYVFGVVAGAPMQSARGRERRLVAPGTLVAWDPSHDHTGVAVDGRPWQSRLIIVESADLAALAADGDSDPLTDVAFPEPVITDPDLVRGFLRMHRAFDTRATRLQRDVQVAEWLAELIERFAAARPVRPPLSPRDDRAFRVACDYLAEGVERNISLDELAAATAVGKFRLIRLFRERTGLPPHAVHLAHRVRHARRLIEAGRPLPAVAAATGFADQSHFHRHFRRGLGITPGEYRRRFQT